MAEAKARVGLPPSFTVGCKLEPLTAAFLAGHFFLCRFLCFFLRRRLLLRGAALATARWSYRRRFSHRWQRLDLVVFLYENGFFFLFFLFFQILFQRFAVGESLEEDLEEEEEEEEEPVLVEEDDEIQTLPPVREPAPVTPSGGGESGPP